jgi:hypothetical protein
MLVSGFRSLARAWPVVLSAAGGLAVVLTRPAWTPTGPKAACFPDAKAGEPERPPKPFSKED